MSWRDAPVIEGWQSAPEVDSAPKRPTVRQFLDEAMRPGRDLLAGAIRGAGSIGSTLLAPNDILNAVLMKQPAMSINQQRRQDITGGLESLGADPESLAFQVGKPLAEIAGVAGVGPALASVMRPGAVSAAIGSAGFNAGGMTGAKGLGVRSLGGAVTGGASAGLVNPEDAGLGAAIGGVLPGAVQAAGAVGRSVGGAMRGPQADPRLLKSAEEAIGAGYVIPPTQVKPTLGNRLLEGFAGKLTTAQNASARNAQTTSRLVNKALGLADDVELNPETLRQIRSTAGRAYEEIANAVGTVNLGPAYLSRLDAIAEPARKAASGFPGAKPSPVIELVESLKTEAADGAAVVAKISELRAAATDGFRLGNTDLARAQRSAAELLEDMLGANLRASGNRELLKQFQDARTLIAKTYSVEAAMNPTTGAIDARKLGSQLTKKKPLSGELRQVADFANRFPTAAKPAEMMGSLPQTSPLDWFGAGGISMATGNPLLMAGVAARPLARAGALSGPIQRGLLNQSRPSEISGLLSDPALQQLLFRGAPVLGVDR